MKSRATAALLATLAMYVWGFLYWGVNPLPYRTWQQTTDDVAAGKALLALPPTILIDFGDIVWWTLPWPWKLHQAAYNLTAILIPGLVLARFMRRDQKTATPNTS